MTTSPATSWQQAHRAPFEAFGILYYPLFRARADLPATVDDEDMTWAITANANLDGTGYTLSQPSILTLAAYHHAMVQLSRDTAFLPVLAPEGLINPLDDLRRLVPDVTATPMYPDFPTQVMGMSEAQFRYDQMCHYLSTYGVEELAGALGLDVSVSEGWLPDAAATPKTQSDDRLVAPKVLHLMVTIEDLRSVVSSRLARATRMHEAEIQTTLLACAGDPDGQSLAPFPAIAFHENMMELIRVAAQADSSTLERVATALAQHPGDLLKAALYLLESQPKNHLLTRQKKGLCRAFEHFDTASIARNIADAGRSARLVPNFLSAARFGGPRLREAIRLVESGEVRSWESELERRWGAVGAPDEPARQKMRVVLEGCHAEGVELSASMREAEGAWQHLLAHYGTRPGVLLRSLTRLVKGGCPAYLLSAEVNAHAASYSLPTLVSTVTALSSDSDGPVKPFRSLVSNIARSDATRQPLDPTTFQAAVELLKPLIEQRLQAMETPLRGRRVYLDTAGISLVGSALRPNETGETGTAWPPVGIAFDLPTDKTLRFFTFWDDRERRVDVDLHFEGRTVAGEDLHVGWNGSFQTDGMATSGDITTSKNSVEYLDIDMAAAREAGVEHVVQVQHIYSGRAAWADIQTCYAGALVVKRLNAKVRHYNAQNLLFRDDLTGPGTHMSYATINVPNHYVRIMRGANMPLGDLGYSLADYLDALFLAQGVTLVDSPDEADLRVCVGRSDDPEVVSLFDRGFFLG